MGEFSTATVSALQSLFVKRAVQNQGGLLTGQNPTDYNTSDPLRLWVIQLSIIIFMAQLLGLILGKIRQPRVIAEILGGILLGPTAFGQIPGFTSHIFPPNSLPFLSLTAQIGLCLFLFIIGLEIDPSIIRRNARLSIVVSLAGVVFPFAIGCGVAAAVYHHLIDSSTNFNYFMLFIGVSYSITAFPVLCRILSALNLLDTTVGLIALSAGVANDVIGWTLLALAVAFVNASSGLTALWIFITCVAFTLFLLFPIKWALRWLARKTGSTVHGPTVFYMSVVILVLWGAAFFTDIVGVNAIFGAFIVGVIVPREGGISIAFVEKLEDMVQIIFLPIYFTISGLNTNLGLINTGTAWGFVFAIASLDFTGKFTGCTLSSRALGFSWREATAVGSLMSCKGLVELIVLNVGLSAGILTKQVFSMFVLEALILTFTTTPLVNLIYPPKYRTFGLGVGVGRTASKDDNERVNGFGDSEVVEDETRRHRFAVVLHEFDQLPGIMALTKLVLPPPTSEESASHARKLINASVNVHRLIELSERTSSAMKSAMAETLINTDPLVGVFKMIGEQSNMPISASLSVVAHNEWADAVAEHAERLGSQLVLVPWIPPWLGSTADSSDPGQSQTHGAMNPFDTFFGHPSKDSSASMLHSHFVRGVFRHSKTDVALFVDLGDNGGTNGQQHILFPFFGGPDDRLALEFVVQLCANPRISATVVRVGKKSEQFEIAKPEPTVVDERATLQAGSLVPESFTPTNTVYGKPNTAYFLQSDAADDLTWSRYASPVFEKDKEAHAQLRSVLSRMEFTDLSHALPLHALMQRAKQLRETHRRLLVVVGRSKRVVPECIKREVKQLVEERKYSANSSHEMVRNTIGEVGAAFVGAADAQSGVIVVQAAGEV